MHQSFHRIWWHLSGILGGSEIPGPLRGGVEDWGLMGTWGLFRGSLNVSLRNFLVFRELCVMGGPGAPGTITSLI